MKWEIITTNKRHIIEANSSATAVMRVKETDEGFVSSCKLMPKTIKGKMKYEWKRWTNRISGR
jgi:hypothetical protein